MALFAFKHLSMKHFTLLGLLFIGQSTYILAQQQVDSVFSKKTSSGRHLGGVTMVNLNDGSTVWGTLTQWQQGDSLVMTTYEKIRLKFAVSQIVRVKQFTPRKLANRQLNEPLEIETSVYLTDGSVFRGMVADWVQNESVLLVTHEGVLLTFKMADVKRIKQARFGGPPMFKVGSVWQRREKTYKFKETGRYTTLCFGKMIGGNEGFTFTTVSGYQFNRLNGIGLGIGLNRYVSDYYYKLSMLPIFVDYRGYLLKKRWSPYFDLMVGHSFAIDLMIYDLPNPTTAKKNGGTFISPNVGFRFGDHFTVDLGVHIQRGGFQVSTPFGEVSEDLLFRNGTLRIGVVF